MSTLAIVNMILVVGVIVGGFTYFVRMAAGKEKNKAADHHDEE